MVKQREKRQNKRITQKVETKRNIAERYSFVQISKSFIAQKHTTRNRGDNSFYRVVLRRRAKSLGTHAESTDSSSVFI